jgi:hypothetical protein
VSCSPPDTARPLEISGPHELVFLGVLCDAQYRLALGLAHRVLGTSAAAENLVPEAFLTVWRSGRIDDPIAGSTRRWLLDLVRKRSIAVRHARTTTCSSA